MARMREHPELGTDVGAALVHGYAARHPRPDGDFDPDAHRRPDTILRPNKAEERIEAYRDAIAAGRSPPFLPSAVVPVRQSAARARAEGTIQAVREVSALRRGREP